MTRTSVGDARFFARSGPYSLAAVAEAATGTTAAAGVLLTGVAPLATAGPGEVSFLDNRRYASALEETAAGAVIVHPDMLGRVPAGTAAILTTEPYAGWARVAALFHPLRPLHPGRHPTACVEDGARVDPTAQIGAYALVASGAEVGPRSWIGPYASVGEGVVIGADCRIGAHVSLCYTIIGARVHLHPGARIGQQGFGFAATKDGFLTVPHLGRVILGDDVQVGANTTIDRGSVGDTEIGCGSRIDNLVQIAHNVRVGRCCVIVAQVGIAGSTVLEDFVQVGGQAALAGHLHVARGARIGAQAGVISDVAPGAALVGSPAQPRRDYFRQVATIKRLASRGE
ncbi:MAG TPA: UDP-3-O-(3-hydroxymyristoyl)glucosamine N-acyltransferase [Roseomonas sp.]|jgi:UDP-3-O-[3-hydroxymyristoyl] glucosamine N-acyltransferase